MASLLSSAPGTPSEVLQAPVLQEGEQDSQKVASDLSGPPLTALPLGGACARHVFVSVRVKHMQSPDSC